MGLKFFADHCVSNAVIRALREADHEVFILKEYIPRDSPDPVVIAKAQALSTILVSLNGDFADIIVYPPSKYKGIIALQVKNHPEVIPALMERLLNYFSVHPKMDHYQGKLLVVEPGHDHRFGHRLGAVPTLQIQAVDFLTFVGWAWPTTPYRLAACSPNDDQGLNNHSNQIADGTFAIYIAIFSFDQIF